MKDFVNLENRNSVIMFTVTSATSPLHRAKRKERKKKTTRNATRREGKGKPGEKKKEIIYGSSFPTCYYISISSSLECTKRRKIVSQSFVAVFSSFYFIALFIVELLRIVKRSACHLMMQFKKKKKKITTVKKPILIFQPLTKRQDEGDVAKCIQRNIYSADSFVMPYISKYYHIFREKYHTKFGNTAIANLIVSENFQNRKTILYHFNFEPKINLLKRKKHLYR